MKKYKKRTTKIVLSCLLALSFVIPTFANPGFAQSEAVVSNGQTITDGTYETNFLLYKTGTKEASGMAARFAQPGKLIVEKGEARLQLDIITQNSMLGALYIPYKGETIEMTTIQGSLETETRTITLPIDTFDKAITVNVDVVFPGSETPVKQTFDIIVASPETKLTEEVVIEAYKYGTTEKSLMQQFLNPLAKLVLEDDHYKVQITFTNKDYIESLTINNTKAEIVSTNGEAVTYSVEVKNVKQLLDATMEVNANGMKMTQQAHLRLAVKGAPVMITNPFRDIEKLANKEAVLNLLNLGIVKSAEQYNPNSSLTRGQFSLMLARTLNLTEQTAPAAGFTDISGDAERQNAINALAQAEIVVATEKFNPNNNITRQQAAVMIYRAMQYHVGTDTLDFGNNIQVYADAATVKSEEAQLALSFLYASKAMTGTEIKGERYINAQSNLTRDQMAKILNGTLKYLGR